MKYFLATLYLAVGIVLPFLYVNLAEAGNIQTREWILILALFVFCTAAGVMWLFENNKETNAEKESPKPKPSPFKTPDQRSRSEVPITSGRKIPQPVTAQPKVVTAPRYIEPPAQKPREATGFTYPPREKPEIKALMEDVKNFIKLESWLMALQKANELIHYYPDSPEADKVRGNINFLIQKTKGHD